MPEQNETTVNPLLPNEVCTIRIMFPVTSDEQAIEYKRKIQEALSNVPNVQLQFSIMNNPRG